MQTPDPEWKKTACILCSINCGIEVQLGGEHDRHIVRVRGDDAHPASRGYVCEKSQRMDHYQNGADRLTSPLRRRPDGSYEAISWDVAIREIADKFMAIKAAHGGESILYYGGGGQEPHPLVHRQAKPEIRHAPDYCFPDSCVRDAPVRP